MRALSVSIVGLTLLGLGCASVPVRQADDLGLEVPGDWGSAAQERTTANAESWADSFGDPQLTALIAESLEHNRDLRAAAARVEAAKAQARIAGADALPSVSAGIDGSRQRQNFIGFPIPGGGDVLSTTATRVGTSVDVSWEPDLWGRIKAGRMAALADQAAVQHDLESARLAVAAQTARSWFALTSASLQHQLAVQTVEAYESSLEGTQRRYRLGLSPSLDLRLLRTQLSDARALLALREVELKQAGITLELILGRIPRGDDWTPNALPDVPAPLPPGVPADVLARRPDLRAAEARLAAADARYAQARRALYPSLRLTGNAGTASNELGDLLDGDFRVWSLLAGLAQPIFQGGRLRANVSLSDANVQQALESFASSALSAFAEVETALAIDSALTDRETALRETKDEADAARELAESQYKAGLVNVLAVLDSRRRSLAASSQLIAAHAQRLNNRIDLYLALGGDPLTASSSPVSTTVLNTRSESP